MLQHTVMHCNTLQHSATQVAVDGKPIENVHFEDVAALLTGTCVDIFKFVEMQCTMHHAILMHNEIERWGAGVEYHFQKI